MNIDIGRKKYRAWIIRPDGTKFIGYFNSEGEARRYVSKFKGEQAALFKTLEGANWMVAKKYIRNKKGLVASL